MNRMVLSAILCPFLCLGAQAQTPDAGAAPSQTAILYGAYQPISSDNPLVQEARDFAQSRMLSMTFGEVSVAYVQVVAGMNVKLVCNVTEDGQPSSWKFVVYKSLDGKWHMGLAERL